MNFGFNQTNQMKHILFCSPYSVPLSIKFLPVKNSNFNHFTSCPITGKSYVAPKGSKMVFVSFHLVDGAQSAFKPFHIFMMDVNCEIRATLRAIPFSTPLYWTLLTDNSSTILDRYKPIKTTKILRACGDLLLNNDDYRRSSGSFRWSLRWTDTS